MSAELIWAVATDATATNSTATAAATIPAVATTATAATATAAAPDKTQKIYWGPRLWRLLHLLAELSDRRDIHMLWPNLLRITSVVMPCEACRVHLATYLRSHVFVHFKKSLMITGELVRDRVRTDLLSFHNDVNRRLGKLEWTQAEIMTTYSVSGTRSRIMILSEVQSIFEELKSIWTPIVHTRIKGGDFNTWKTHVAMMIALVSGGPN
jgi:hypothetical protein